MYSVVHNSSSLKQAIDLAYLFFTHQRESNSCRVGIEMARFLRLLGNDDVSACVAPKGHGEISKATRKRGLQQVLKTKPTRPWQLGCSGAGATLPMC